jgi:hypothetical protein
MELLLDAQEWFTVVKKLTMEVWMSLWQAAGLVTGRNEKGG